MKHRDVDVVIKNDKDMEDFITLMTWSMNSVNNSRDTAKHVYRQLRKHRMNSLTTDEQYENTGTEGSIQLPNKSIKIDTSDKHAILRTTLLKYKIMRIRAKISYQALKSGLTI